MSSKAWANSAPAKWDQAYLDELEQVACPSAGSCGGQFTANTMACVSEAIGLALPGSAGAPAPYESRDMYGFASGEAVMDAAQKQNPPARYRNAGARLKTPRWWWRQPAARPMRRCICLRLHMRRVSISICMRSAGFSQRTPYIASLKPGGKYVAKDLYEIGGVAVVMKELLDAGLLHGDCLTVTGKTQAENPERTSRSPRGRMWWFLSKRPCRPRAAS